MNDIELIDEIVKRAEERQKQREKEFAISELETIKAEINAKERVELSTKEMWYNFALENVTHIIEEHIAELKEGEPDVN